MNDHDAGLEAIIDALSLEEGPDGMPTQTARDYAAAVLEHLNQDAKPQEQPESGEAVLHRYFGG